MRGARRAAAIGPTPLANWLPTAGLAFMLTLLCALFLQMEAKASKVEAPPVSDARWTQIHWQCSAVPNVIKRQACVSQLAGPLAGEAPRAETRKPVTQFTQDLLKH
jgi:hypothetical protein